MHRPRLAPAEGVSGGLISGPSDGLLLLGSETFVPLLTYSVLGKEFVSLEGDNNLRRLPADRPMDADLCGPSPCSYGQRRMRQAAIYRTSQMGGSDPKKLLGRLKAEKVNRVLPSQLTVQSNQHPN